MSICVRSKILKNSEHIGPFDEDIEWVYNECYHAICRSCPEPIIVSVSHSIVTFPEFCRTDVSVVVTWRRPS